MELKNFYWPSVILMAVSALFWPFWITVILFLAGIFLFRNFYPGLIILFIMDAVYGFETIKFMGIYGFLTTGGIFIYAAANFVKEKSRLGTN